MTKKNIPKINRKNLRIGIDLGSKDIKAVITLQAENTDSPRILAAIREESTGILNGQVVSIQDSLLSLKKLLRKVENSLGFKIDRASVGLSAACIKVQKVKIKTSVAKASNEVSELDLTKTKDEALASINIDSPYEVLHTSLAGVTLDGKRINKNPIGMIASKLEIDYILVLIPRKALEDILKVFDLAGVYLSELTHNSLITSITATSKRDRIYGVAVLDIGYDNSTLTVYENDLPVVIKEFSLGGNNFTKDITMGLGITMAEAENLKTENRLSGDRGEGRKIQNIVDARVDDLVEIINKEMIKAIPLGKPQNGLVIVGGGSELHFLADKLKKKLAMPVTLGRDILAKATEDILQDGTWIASYSLSRLDTADRSLYEKVSEWILTSLRQLFQKIAP